MLWDIFCRVIDNFGDIGVCWRLGSQLAQRGQQVRLWVDDTSALAWMAPGALQGDCAGIQVLDWHCAEQPDFLQALPRASVWIEAFGCELPEAFVAHHASAAVPQPAWINLEYLSAEPYVERSHGLPSPVMQGPARGWTKHFFYPGFTRRTGGLMRPPSAAQEDPGPLLNSWGVPEDEALRVSLFCYEPALLPQWIDHWAQQACPTRLLVSAGRATRAVQAVLGPQRTRGRLQVHYLPLLPQPSFDALLDACDLNCVRGEDSVVRALWAGKPLLWQLYPQDDGAAAPKLEAFLAQMQWSAPVCQLHRDWNAPPATSGPPAGTSSASAPSFAALAGDAWATWQAEAVATREKLLEMPDLLSQLLQWERINR